MDSKDVTGVEAIGSALAERYGELIRQEDLAHVLSYPTTGALKKAATRGTLPIRLFSIPHRKGKFALTREVAEWLATLKKEEAE